MEENNNMTAERSLEIITKQIEQSRRDVSKDVGQSLFISGLCTMCMALFIGLCILCTANTAFYLLFLTLPIVIYAILRYVNRNQTPTPSSLIGSMVHKTWVTFAIFAIAFFVLANLYNAFMGRMESAEVFSRLMVHPFRIILLLMGMTITITGYILKSRWLVWCGIIGGLGGFIWESFYVTQTIVGRLFPLGSNYMGIASGLIPGIIIAIFAFIGLTLPGMMLKKKSL